MFVCFVEASKMPISFSVIVLGYMSSTLHMAPSVFMFGVLTQKGHSLPLPFEVS